MALPRNMKSDPRTTGFSPHLKELAGRLNKLSYMEMLQFSQMLREGLQTVQGEKLDLDAPVVAEALLAVAERIVPGDSNGSGLD